jgi:hypothetical protein
MNTKIAEIDSVCFDSWLIPEFEPLQKPEAESEMSGTHLINFLN